jgi:hypothetical protein
MTDSKPFASLSSVLLARKGGAKPAMRPQVAPLHPHGDEHHEDLGWNDLGEDVPYEGAEIVQMVPEVVRQQRTMAARVKQPVSRRSALADGRRAAFTLRVDAERHLKLRLACTVLNKSAQQLVTEVLDRLIDELPEVSDLAERVAARR